MDLDCILASNPALHDCLGRLKGFSDGLNKSLEKESTCVPHTPYVRTEGFVQATAYQ